MADDERRAEIEAVALNEFAAWLRAWRDGIDVYDPATQGIYDALDAVLVRFGAALDRVRDARGDDEACPNCGKPSACPPAEVYCVDCATEGWEQDAAAHRAARSPQGEDHEAGVEAVARALLPEGVGSWDEQSDLQRSYLLRQARIAVDTIDHAVHGPAPSRDGTVAVEDVVRRIVARIRKGAPCDSDAPHLRAAAIADAIEREFARPATGEQTDHGGNQDDERRH